MELSVGGKLALTPKYLTTGTWVSRLKKYAVTDVCYLRSLELILKRSNCLWLAGRKLAS